jgi:hypothetical protein
MQQKENYLATSDEHAKAPLQSRFAMFAMSLGTVNTTEKSGKGDHSRVPELFTAKGESIGFRHEFKVSLSPFVISAIFVFDHHDIYLPSFTINYLSFRWRKQ